MTLCRPEMIHASHDVLDEKKPSSPADRPFRIEACRPPDPHTGIAHGYDEGVLLYLKRKPHEKMFLSPMGVKDRIIDRFDQGQSTLRDPALWRQTSS